MAITYLNNLPSLDKDNFSNFQPDLNQYAPKRQQSFMVGTAMMMDDDQQCYSDSGDEQVIVNQRCNIIIQYLDKHNRDNETAQIFALVEKSKKRDIREVLDTNPETCESDSHESLTTSPTSSSKYMKKRRTSIQNAESMITNLLPSSTTTRTMTSDADPIEIDFTATTGTTTSTIDPMSTDYHQNNIDF